MESLVLELQREAYLNNTSVTDLTRKAYVLARKLDVMELMLWLKQEMEGYVDNKQGEVPLYRLVQGHLKALNPYNGYIPANFGGKIDEKLNKKLLLQPIGEIESLIEKANVDKGVLMYTFPPAMQMKFMQAVGVNFEISLHIPVSQFENILNRVRDIILEWTLKLEDKGVLGEGMTFNEKEKEKANEVSSITNIIGTMMNSQLQQNTSNSTQNLGIGEFKVESLKDIIEQGKALLEKITDNDTRAELQAELLVLEAQTSSPKPKKNTIKESLQTIRSIAEGVSGSLIATGIVETIIPLLALL